MHLIQKDVDKKAFLIDTIYQQGYIKSVLEELRMKKIFTLTVAVMLLTGTFAFAKEGFARGLFCNRR